MCEDRKCSFSGPCWVDAENSAHINLTHLHLRTWAAAIVSSTQIEHTFDHTDLSSTGIWS